MCIAEGEGSRFSALLNSGLFEFQIFTNLATKSGYIKLTEICLYFCPYRKTLILIGLNAFPAYLSGTGKYSDTTYQDCPASEGNQTGRFSESRHNRDMVRYGLSRLLFS